MFANFLVIGTKRCGTSWLKHNLAKHPDIFMTQDKGVHFFDLHYDKGIPFYETFFVEGVKKKLRGEVEHSYFESELVAERIYKSLGSIPLILSLRHPVERAYSHFQVLRRNLSKKGSYDFETTFIKGMENGHDEIIWGFYGKQLKAYLNFFSIKNFHIIKFEDLIENPQSTIKNVYQFLGVDPNFVSELVEKKWSSVTNVPKGTGNFRSMLFYTSNLATLSRKLLRKVGFNNIKLYHKFSPPPLDHQLKKKLTRYFDEDIMLLEHLTGLDFSPWLSENC